MEVLTQGLGMGGGASQLIPVINSFHAAFPVTIHPQVCFFEVVRVTRSLTLDDHFMAILAH